MEKLFTGVTVFLTAAICVSLLGREAAAAGKLEINFSPQDGLLAIKAEDMSIREILGELKRQHGIEVSTLGLDDRNVTVSIEPSAIHDAIKQLVGEAQFVAHYKGEHKVKVAHVQEAPPQPEPPNAGPPPIKTSVERLPRTTKGPATGSEPHAKDTTVAGRPRIDEAHPDQHVTLTVRLTETSVELTHFTRTPGPATMHRLVLGHLFYVGVIGGEVVWVKSMPDPLYERSHRENNTGRVTGRAKEVHVNVELPEKFLDRDALAGKTEVRFYLVPEDKPLPERNDLRLVSTFLAGIEPLGVIDSASLLRVYKTPK